MNILIENIHNQTTGEGESPNLRVPVFPSEHTQRFDREDELVVRIGDHDAFVEDAFDALLLPLSVLLLPAHDEPDGSHDGLLEGIFRNHESDHGPARHDDLTLTLHIDAGFASFVAFSPAAIISLLAYQEFASLLHAGAVGVRFSDRGERFEREHAGVGETDAPAAIPGSVIALRFADVL